MQSISSGFHRHLSSRKALRSRVSQLRGWFRWNSCFGDQTWLFSRSRSKSLKHKYCSLSDLLPFGLPNLDRRVMPNHLNQSPSFHCKSPGLEFDNIARNNPMSKGSRQSLVSAPMKWEGCYVL